jgi:hypothetical protein
MSKIPTAKEFLNTQKNYTENLSVLPLDTSKIIKQNMIEFARLHVEAALKEVLENIPCLSSSTDIASYEEVEETVLNAYPLENIK